MSEIPENHDQREENFQQELLYFLSIGKTDLAYRLKEKVPADFLQQGEIKQLLKKI